MRINFLQTCVLLLSFLPVKSICQHATDAHKGVKLQARAFLQGALIGAEEGLMRDDLRAKGLLPLTSPYPRSKDGVPSGEERIGDPSVLEVQGVNAVVDWVFIELRSAADPKTVLATSPALLQRDGDVVAADGVSPLYFPSLVPGAYHVAIRHRNHLGAMTLEAFDLGEVPELVDFSSPDFPTFGQDAQAHAGKVTALWGGNANRDQTITIHGANSDADAIFHGVMTAPGNANFSKNFIHAGYFMEDVNLDGMVIYEGPGSDLDHLLFGIYYPWFFECPYEGVTCVPIERLP